MLTIVSTAIQFAAGYVATDRALLVAKKRKEIKDQLHHRFVMRKYGVKREFNYAPLFGG